MLFSFYFLFNCIIHLNNINSIILTNFTKPVRVEYTTCSYTDSGSSSSYFYVSFPSVPSFQPQQIVPSLYSYSTTFKQVYFLEDYPSSINITAQSSDGVCLTSIVINDYKVNFPEGDIYLDYPCNGAYNGNSKCKVSNVWTFPKVDYEIPAYGLQVTFRTCSLSGSGSDSNFYVSFPSVPSFATQKFSQTYYNYPANYYETYRLNSIPTDITITADTSDALCLSGIIINNVTLNFTNPIWLDSPCTGTYSSGPCYQSYTWKYSNVTNYGPFVYFFYHTCTYSDSASSSSSFFVTFPSVLSYHGLSFTTTFSKINLWYYQTYLLESYPTDITITPYTSDEICLDSMRFNEDNSMYFKKSHYYLDDPCTNNGGKNYTKYCYEVLTWNVNVTEKNNNDDDNSFVDDVQFLITASLIIAIVTLTLIVIGFCFCCTYINFPNSRKILGKEEFQTNRSSMVNPLINQNKTTVTLPQVELSLNSSSGAPEADRINNEHDQVVRLALEDIRLLAQNDQEYLIGKVKFSVSSSKLTKLIEMIVIAVMGGIAISINNCPTKFCKIYVVISIYLWFFSVLIRIVKYPLSRPLPPKPIPRTIYQMVQAKNVRKFEDRIYYEWNRNGTMVRVYEEPEVGTNEVQISADFLKYQQTLKQQNRLSGPLFKYTPREWTREREEAKADLKVINERNRQLAYEENQKREIKQKELDQERHIQENLQIQKYRQAMLDYEVWCASWEVALSYIFCILNVFTVILFICGLFWNVTCSNTGTIICDFIIFPTVIFEWSFILKYTKREKISFVQGTERVINV